MRMEGIWMISLKEKLVENAKRSREMLQTKDLTTYKGFCEYMTNLLTRRSLSGYNSFTCWLNTDFLYKEKAELVARELIYFQQFAKENKLKFIIHAEESEKNNPLVTIEW